MLATPAAAAASVQDVVKSETGEDSKAGHSATGSTAAGATPANEEEKKEKKDSTNKHDKVKVAKKIVKDMEKWAKQLNQKKDYTVVATPQPILPSKSDDVPARGASAGAGSSGHLSSGYADVGFSILEKKERTKLVDYMPTPASANKLTAYASDSDEEHAALGPSTSAGAAGASEASEKDYVDFQKLTCLLCKRAFQSLEILQKHLKMSNLHKENLQKFNLARGASGGGDAMSVGLA